MTLASFIAANREEILRRWEKSALERLPAQERVDVESLRRHLGDLLEAIGHDLDAANRAPPTGDAGPGQTTWSHVEAVAETYGAYRARAGTKGKALMPEFPLLRSTVAQFWRESLRSATVKDLDDLIRFDEAMDRAATQSLAEFIDRLNRSREMFLSILGHDLRNPLATIISATALMQEEWFDRAKADEMLGRINATAKRMQRLVVDLLDFARTRLGGEMPIRARDMDLRPVIQHVADEFRTAHPKREVRVHIDGDLRGRWDDTRMTQAVDNLLMNAHTHGAPDRPIDLSVSATGSEIRINVHNEGPVIPDDRQRQIFEPWEIGGDSSRSSGSSHVGLGLFITKTIVKGHGGHVHVESTPDRGTTFTICLPRGGVMEPSEEPRGESPRGDRVA